MNEPPNLDAAPGTPERSDQLQPPANEAGIDIDAAIHRIQAGINEGAKLSYEDNDRRYESAIAAIKRAAMPEPASVPAPELAGATPYTSHDMLKLRDQLQQEERVTEERFSFKNGEIIRAQPKVTRLDDRTGEPVIPLVFVRGMGANEALPWYVEQIAQMDRRPVVSIMYRGRFEGSTQPTADESLEGVAEMDVQQAEDIPDALDRLGIPQADLIAESRGGARAVVAMLKHPDRFRKAVLKDIPIDERSYWQRYKDAAREKIGRRKRGPIDLPTGLRDDDKDGAADRAINAGKEYKSVARARLGRLLEKLPESVQATVTYDVSDKAFIPDRIEEVAQRLASKPNLHFVPTDSGGHGFRYDTAAVAESVAQLRALEKKGANN